MTQLPAQQEAPGQRVNTTREHARLSGASDTRDTAPMEPQQPDTAFHQQARELFAFLVTEAGFTGPHPTTGAFEEDRVQYQRNDLRIEIGYYALREPEVATTVWKLTPDGGPGAHPQHADLCCLYVACECGPPQDVPGTAPNPRTMVKRLHQHAAALQRVLPLLDTDHIDELLRRCSGRQLPIEWRTPARKTSHRLPHGRLDTNH